MVQYENFHLHEGERVCRELVDNVPEELKKLYDKQQRHGLEHVLAFSIAGGEIELSSIKKGNTGSVSRHKQSMAISELPAKGDMEDESIGTIHTHPNMKNYMNIALSPGDINNHIRFSDEVEEYDTTLVLTKHEGEYLLFGIESDIHPADAAQYQDRIAEHKRQLDKAAEEGDSVVAEIYKMTGTILEVADQCSVKFTV